MFKKVVLPLIALILTLTCVPAMAEEVTANETTEWITLAEAKVIFAEAIGEDTFELTLRSWYWVDKSTDAWLQFEGRYGSICIGMNDVHNDVRLSAEVISKLEDLGAKLDEDSIDFTISPDIFPWQIPNEIVLTEEWGEILLEKAMLEEFILRCAEPVHRETD